MENDEHDDGGSVCSGCGGELTDDELLANEEQGGDSDELYCWECWF